MDEILSPFLVWPVFPFSLLVGLVTLYWILVILGGVDLDLFDVDFDLDLNAEPSWTDFGLVGLKWFNLGDVPLMLWLSAFALSSFMVTYLFDRDMPGATMDELALVVVRNVAIGIVAAKLMTQPFKGKLKFKEPNTVQELIGKICVVISPEVTTHHGIAECAIEDGAPLRLNVRTLEGVISKNTEVEIIDYFTDTGVYYVRPNTTV